MYSEVGKMENTEFPRICRFVKLLVNEGFLAVKTGCELRESMPVQNLTFLRFEGIF